MRAGWLGGLILGIAGVAIDAFAHRLDEYLQAARIAVAPHGVDLSMDLTPGMAIAEELLIVIDTDRDQRVSKEEAAAYGRRVLKDIRLELDERPLVLSLGDVSFPELREIRGGVGVIRIKAAAQVGALAAGGNTLSLTNAHLPAMSVYLVNALVPKDPSIRITKQTRDALQRGYRLEFGLVPNEAGF